MSPAAAEMTALGETVQLTASVSDQNGQALAGTSVSWSSSGTAVATVSASGLVSAVGNGTATITATAGEASGTAAITVGQAVSAVAVSPAADTLLVGDTLRLSAEATDANGHAVEEAEFAWESGDAAIAAVDATGLVTAVGAGEAEITATSSGVTGRAALSVVAPAPTTVAVTPDTVALTALGHSAQFAAEVRDQSGRVMTDAAVSWTSGDTAVAVVDSTGSVTAIGNGTATITAVAGEVSGTAAITVDQAVSAVAVSPAADTLLAADTLRLTAEATDATGHAVEEAEFAWESGDAAIAAVDATGLVTAVGAGEAEITATSSGVTGRAALSVVAPAPTTVAVTPDTVALTALGHSAQFAAEVRDQSGRVMTDAAVSWTSGDTAVAVVDSTGSVTAVGNGTATITAVAGEASGHAVALVMQSAGSVIVTPAADSIARGDTLRLSAEALDENGHAVVGANFSWSSSNGSVATVDASGLVLGVAEGTATISAVAGSAQGTAQITVSNPDRAALVAFYEATGGRNWVNSENWLTEAPLRDWYGVTMAGDRVRFLHLRENGLTGRIPPELGRLTRLGALYLDNNALTGPIPPELGRLTGLGALELRSNALTGPIPPELGNTSLFHLDLRRNELTGPIPPELGRLTGLGGLFLGQNALTGPIPPELGNTSLRYLVLGRNELTGPIPPELGKLTRLRWLRLQENALTGPIPPGLGNTNLEALFLDNNELSGPIPPELGKLKNLRRLNVTVNPGLRGEIPPEVLALDMDYFRSHATGLCVPRTAGFESYISRDGWMGYACGETEPGFQIRLVFSPDTPDDIREVMSSQAEYWMEILRDTEAPDLFGQTSCVPPDWYPSIPVIDDIVVDVEYGERRTHAGICGVEDLLQHRIPYLGGVVFSTAVTRDPRWLEIVARHEIGHVLGLGSLWHVRRQIGNPSTEEKVLDTYVVAPLATRAFDAAGGTSYTGPKVPLHQHGGGRNDHWRTEVFGSELMSWGWSDQVPTSAVTLQGLADLGYTVDLSYADPYRLPGAAALGKADAPPLFELGWEARSTVEVCRPRAKLQTEPEGLRTGPRRSGLSSNVCAPAW